MRVWCVCGAEMGSRDCDLRAHLRGPQRQCDVRNWEGGDGDTRCQDCGHAYLPWVTDNPLWNRVVGGPSATSDPGGFLCPPCFMWQTADYYDDLGGDIIWRVVPMWKPGR